MKVVNWYKRKEKKIYSEQKEGNEVIAYKVKEERIY